MRRPWIILKPTEIKKIEDNLYTVDDVIPGIHGVNRRMSIVKQKDGSLIFYNAIPLRDKQLEFVNSLGKPVALIVPNHFHLMDADAFSKKLQIPIFTSQGSLARTNTFCDAQLISALKTDDSIEVLSVDGFATQELTLVVKHASGSTFICADVVANSRHTKGFGGLVMKVIGFTGDTPRLPWPVKKRVGRNLKSVAEFLHNLAAKPDLKRIIPSHGEQFDGDTQRTLKSIAATV
jgi:hypothetical protein